MKSCNVTMEEMENIGMLSTSFAGDVLVKNQYYNIQIFKKDRHSRFICDINTPFLNYNTYSKQIIASGYAVAFLKYIPNKHDRSLYSILQEEAKTHREGLWNENHMLMNCLKKKAK